MTHAPTPTGRSALVLGATGLVGSHLVDLLHAHPAYRAVTALVRRPLDRDEPGLNFHVVDYDALEMETDRFQVDDVFCALGTTIRKAGSNEAFRRVDIEYPATSARLAAEGGAEQFLVVSALGADPDSLIFYNRAKGEMEREVRAAPLRAVWIFRPALLLGDRAEVRIGERVAEAVLRPIAPLMLGPLRRYRPVQAADVARAMIRCALADGTGGVVESDQIATLGSSLPE